MSYLTEISNTLDGLKFRTRFAPGVTGRLHLGHVVNAIYVWGTSKALKGEVVLRLEDHSRDRWSQKFEDFILIDLYRLGLAPDFGTFAQFRLSEPSEYRQSDCYHHYSNALEELRDSYNVYVCDCIGVDRMASWQGIYDGHCRNRGLKWKTGRRLRVEIPDEPIKFLDVIMGPQKLSPGNFKGDPEIINPRGNWSYLFTVVVDDYRHGINTVIRGKGLLAATPSQILLASMLGLSSPSVWIHHEEIIDPVTSVKLSKRNGAPSIGEMMNYGERPQTILGRAAVLASLQPANNEIDAVNLDRLFK